MVLVSVYSMVTVVVVLAALQMVRNWNLPSLSASCGLEEEDVSDSVPSGSTRLLSRAFPSGLPLRVHQKDLVYGLSAIVHEHIEMIGYNPKINMKQISGFFPSRCMQQALLSLLHRPSLKCEPR